jgi:hypothetical protein
MFKQRMQIRSIVIAAIAALAVLMLSLNPGGVLAGARYKKETSKVMNKVQKRGFLRCGVAPEDAEGFIYFGPEGPEGFDVDFCKALAVAIFNDDTRVEYVVPASWPDRFTLLQDNEIDVLFAVASWTASRDSELGVDFPATYFYDTYLGVTDSLGPAVAHGDQQWADIVRWVVYGMIIAEELGVDSENVIQMVKDPPADPRVWSLLGLQDDVGLKLGLGNDFMVNVIYIVGNYGEVYTRHLEPGAPRAGSLNALWTEGGILHAPIMQ